MVINETIKPTLIIIFFVCQMYTRSDQEQQEYIAKYNQYDELPSEKLEGNPDIYRSPSDQLSRPNSCKVLDQDPLRLEDVRVDRENTMVIEDQPELLHFNRLIRQASQILTYQEAIQQLITEEKWQFMKKNIDKIIKIQSLYRMKKQQRKLKTRKKWAVYRKHVLYELRDSEKTYVQDLTVIINLLKQITDECILSDEEIKKLFSNIENIYNLNKNFAAELKEKIDAYTHRSEYGKFLEQYAYYFKLYYVYSHDFNVETTRLLKEQNERFYQLIDSIETAEDSVFRGLNLESFLVKPIQRVPKYILLLKDLIKHTEDTHPDYQALVKALEIFIKVTAGMNAKIEAELRTSKMFDLQRLFGDPNKLSILDPSRQFLCEETLNVLHDKDKEKSVIVYFLTDMLLITSKSHGSEKLYKQVIFDDKSFCKDKVDLKYVRHLFTVIGKFNSVSFVCQSEEQKQKYMAQIDQMIHDLKQIQMSKIERLNLLLKREQHKKIYPIYVITKNTEEKQTIFGRYTAYNMLISMGNNKIEIQVRFRELCELERIVRADHPKIDLPHISKSNWLNKHKSRVVELRRFIAENFLQTLLQTPDIRANPDKVLHFLDLPLHFYDLCEEVTEQTEVTDIPLDILEKLQSVGDFQAKIIKYSQTQNNHHGFSSTREKKLMTEPSSELLRSGTVFITANSSTNELLRFSRQSVLKRKTDYVEAEQENENRISNRVSNMEEDLNSSIINLSVMIYDGRVLKTVVQPGTKAQEIVQNIAKMIGLHYSLDFRLVHQNGSDQIILNDDEDVYYILRPPKETSKYNIFSRLTQYLQEKTKTKQIFMLKKIIYLGQKQEELDYYSDPIRLHLIVYQIFDDIKKDFYYLNFKEYSAFAALYLYIKYHILSNQIFSPANLPTPKMQEIIPQKIFKEFKDDVWGREIFHSLKTIRQEIKNIREQVTKQQSLENTQIASLILVQTIKSNPLFGVSLYYVESYSKSRQEAYDVLKVPLPMHVYLGFSIYGFYIFSPKNKSILLMRPISDIQEPQYHPNHYSFRLKDRLNRFRFNTSRSQDIQQIFNEYTQILKFSEAVKRQQLQEPLKN